MDHPLFAKDHADLRKRVVQHLKSAYSIRGSSNIIFVCGGNDAENLRPKFAKFCSVHQTDFEIFYPEFAMPSYFNGPIDEPFDIADFEKLVGDLSHAIVVFPEAPGSFAETGYFSAIKDLYRKTLLVLDERFQGSDSFILMGPAKKISEGSVFTPVVQLNYQNPDFAHVLQRIQRVKIRKNKRSLEIKKFSDLDPYDVLCLMHRIVDLMSIATAEDLLRIIQSLSLNRFSAPFVCKILSIMIGAGYLKPVGEYGHLAIEPSKSNLLDVRDGYREVETEIRLRLAEIYQGYNPDFVAIVEQARNAD